MPDTLDRRTFITRGAAVAGGGLLSTTALERLSAANASTARGRPPHGDSYGPLARKPDQRGVEVLALPAGFSYVTFSHSGSTMSDGNPTPLALDGMSAFSGRVAARCASFAIASTATLPVRAAWAATRRRSTTLRPGAARRRSCTTSAGGASLPTGSASTARP